VRTALLLVLCVGVGGLLLGWLLRQVGVGWGRVISFFGGSVVRFTAGVIFAGIAVASADRGGIWYWVLAALLGLLALCVLALEGFRVWAVLKYGVKG
jgi:hypothetical protein